MTRAQLARALMVGAPILAFVGCNDANRPVGPSFDLAAAHAVAKVPSSQGYPLLAYDPIKDRVWLGGGFTTAGALIYDLWTFSTRSRTWTQVVNASGPTSWDATAL